MRILVISDLFPPVSFGGYEMECAAVVGHLKARHEVWVLTSDRGRTDVAPVAGMLRELPYDGWGRLPALLSPYHALKAARVTRRVLAAVRPELVFVWSAIAIPTTAVRVAVDHGAPVAHRLCERWFAQHLMLADHFLRHLARGGSGLRGAWSRTLAVVNRHPELRIDACAPYRAALSWNSDALRDHVGVPPCVQPSLQRTIHPATRNGAVFATLPRRPAPSLLVLYIGRVNEAKGADVAIRALAELERRHRIVAELVLAGPCEARAGAWAEALAATLGVADRVRFAGGLDTARLGETLQRAHVLVAPSRAEAFGLACVEAAAARVPVVAARIDGMPEALREGEHALFFPAGDVAGCAAAVAEALTDEAATAKRVERAFARARELSLERYLAATDAFIVDAAAAPAWNA